REDAIIRTKKDACAQGECSNPPHIARGGCPTESHEQRRHFLGSPPLKTDRQLSRTDRIASRCLLLPQSVAQCWATYNGASRRTQQVLGAPSRGILGHDTSRATNTRQITSYLHPTPCALPRKRASV